MSVHSMTGFARAAGSFGPWSYAWELKSVNAKGLDLRLRTPAGFDAVEIKARTAVSARLSRGAVIGNLAAKREDEASVARINQETLTRLIDALAAAKPPPGVGPATLDGLLSVRGVVEVVEPQESEAQRAELDAHVLSALDDALEFLVVSRAAEGSALAAVLAARLDRLEDLATQADAAPGRQPEAVREKLAAQIAKLLESADGLDPARLHQEAVLLAVKADIREELDRLKTHIAGARDLLAKGGPIGRRLDFLAQELGRETNTLCAKSGDAALTAIGLEMKIEVEQWREQVQNIE